MSLMLMAVASVAARWLEDTPVNEISIDPVTALWITLALILLVALLILANALATPRQVKGYGLDEAHGDSAHEAHH